MNTVVGLIVFFTLIGVAGAAVIICSWGVVASYLARHVPVHAAGDRAPQSGGASADSGSGSLVHAGELHARGDRRVPAPAHDGPGSGDGRLVELPRAGGALSDEEREDYRRAWVAVRNDLRRPSARKVAIWADLRSALDHIKMTEFLLGFAPEKPREIDWEAVQLQLGDARAVLGQVCLALADVEVEP